MKFAVILCCVTILAVASERTWSQYVLEKQLLDIQQQRLQLDILQTITAQNERLERELGKTPLPQRPSLELNKL